MTAADGMARAAERYATERAKVDTKQSYILLSAMFVCIMLIVVVAALLVSDLTDKVGEIYLLLLVIISIANVALVAIIAMELGSLNETLGRWSFAAIQDTSEGSGQEREETGEGEGPVG